MKQLRAGLKKLKTWAKQLLMQIVVLVSALRDPETPLAPRLVMLVVVAYAISPIDLIPDAIPILGFLDEIVLLPLGIKLATYLMPVGQMERHRSIVHEENLGGNDLPDGFKTFAAALVLLTWLIVGAVLWFWVTG